MAKTVKGGKYQIRRRGKVLTVNANGEVIEDAESEKSGKPKQQNRGQAKKQARADEIPDDFRHAKLLRKVGIKDRNALRKATREELIQKEGIGEVTADEIIEDREALEAEDSGEGSETQ